MSPNNFLINLTRATCTGILVGVFGAIGLLGAAYAQGIAAPKMTIHQEVELPASPHAVYEALLDAKKFAALTDMTATISRAEGGAFATFDGIITGRNIELSKDKMIVQAWRPKSWKPGVYSIVKFELTPSATGTKLVLDHTGFPEGAFEGLDGGWPERYWKPLQKYLAQKKNNPE